MDLAHCQLTVQPTDMFCVTTVAKPLGPIARQLGAKVGNGGGVLVIVGVDEVAVAVAVEVALSEGVGVFVGGNVAVGVTVGAAVWVGVGVRVNVGVGVKTVHWPVGPLQLALKTGTQPLRQVPLAPEPHAGTPEKLH
jgi:hypothetical protein